MSNYVLSEEIKDSWKPIIEHASMPEIKDNYKKLVTTVVLENQKRHAVQTGQLTESTAHVNVTGGTQSQGTATMANWDPVLVSLVRRSTPNMLAFDVAGVQPMTGPTGLLFAIRAKYSAPNGSEAGFNEANTFFSGGGSTDANSGQNYRPTAGDPNFADSGNTTIAQNDSSGFSVAQIDLDGNGVGDTAAADSGSMTGAGMDVDVGEQLGTPNAGTNHFREMAFSIEKTDVVARTRALKAEYTTELAQDLRAIHGLDAEAELANILTTEILSEQNRELIRTVNISAKLGGQIDQRVGSLTNGSEKGFYDVENDNDGRWFLERIKGLLLQMEYEANAIAKATRRGRGNFIICSSNVASAFSMAGVLDHAPAISANLTVDDTGNLFAGILNGRIKVYVDPFATVDYITVGYRGANQFDAGIFWAPYVPLEMVRAVGEDSFQPKIGFKTRYGLVANPFATIVDNDVANPIGGQSGLGQAQNPYYRKMLVTNLNTSS